MNNNLDNIWILWYDKINHAIGSDDWDKFLVRISSFGTMESFCNLLGRIIPLSQISAGASYHLFRQYIEPRWEDKNNIEGGKWNLVLQKPNLIKADRLWFLTLAFVMGGSVKKHLKSSITGVVGTVKKGQIRIAIWTKRSKDENLQLCIGKVWKKSIQESMILDKFMLEFVPHKFYKK